MGRQGRPMTKEEGEKIVEYLELNITPNAISKRLRRSSNCIYTYIRNNNLSDKVCPLMPTGRVIDAERPEYKDLSELPNDILFKHINWAIPIIAVLIISIFGCAAPMRHKSISFYCKFGEPMLYHPKDSLKR